MGTRSLTKVYDGDMSDENCKPLICIYRQMDGYPTGIGREMHEQFANTRIINGYGMGQTAPEFANGMGGFAAQLVSFLKGDKIGSVYIFEPDTVDVGEDYTYEFYLKVNKIGMQDQADVYLKLTGYGGKVLYDDLFVDFMPAQAESAGGD